MAQIPDERLEPARGARRRAQGHARGDPRRRRARTGPQLLGNLRQVDALLAVADGFSAGADPRADLETLELELLVADRDHVERRLERVEKQAKSGDPALRKEVEELRRAARAPRRGRRAARLPGRAARRARAADDDAADRARQRPGRHRPPARGGARRAARGGGGRVPRRAVGARRGRAPAEEALDLITFFTAGEKETRAWTLRRGQTALDAAGTIHSDIARGFIRCEVVRWDDLLDAGSHAEAARRGRQRLEGKTYVVEDGDVLNVRFNV